METVLPHDSAVHWSSSLRSSSFTFLFLLAYSSSSRSPNNHGGVCAYDCASSRHEQHVRDRTCAQSPSCSWKCVPHPSVSSRHRLPVTDTTVPAMRSFLKSLSPCDVNDYWQNWSKQKKRCTHYIIDRNFTKLTRDKITKLNYSHHEQESKCTRMPCQRLLHCMFN